MLVLSRRLNEKILFPQINAAVQVVGVKGGTVRLGITAPPEVAVLREELQDRAVRPGQPVTPPAEVRFPGLNQLLRNRLQINAAEMALLRRQLRAGLTQEAEQTLANLETDLQMLRQRLESDVGRVPADSTPAVRKATALLVEDNANERELLATFLRIAGLDVVTAGDGEDALHYLSAHGRPDLILLDMGLPRCDGPTVVRNLRRDPAYADLKIFAVSGHVAEEFDLDSGPAGVNRWFHKPIDPAELVRSLDQELDRSPCRV